MSSIEVTKVRAVRRQSRTTAQQYRTTLSYCGAHNLRVTWSTSLSAGGRRFFLIKSAINQISCTILPNATWKCGKYASIYANRCASRRPEYRIEIGIEKSMSSGVVVVYTYTHTHHTRTIHTSVYTTIFSKRIAVWYFNCLRLVDNAQSQPKRINLLISHEAAQRQQQQQQQKQRLKTKYEIRRYTMQIYRDKYNS